MTELPLVRSPVVAAPLRLDERMRLVRRAKLLAWGGNAWHLVEFAVDTAMEKYGLTFNPGGFLKRLR